MLKSLILTVGAATLVVGTNAIAQGNTTKPMSRAEFVGKIDTGFAQMDTNHDGFLSAAELQVKQAQEIQQLQAARRTKLQSEFKQLDTNKDGQLNFGEFSAAVSKPFATETPAQLIAKLDANKDGKLSGAEFKAPRVAFFNQLDANKDGTVTADELRKAATRK